jgi:hypothetical protein
MENPLLASEAADPRYLAGVLFFNRGDYFEAHEVWEHLWQECDAADRRFFQGLIQAAVALYHAIRGNRVGAARLYGSSKRYLELYPASYRGFERSRFWQTMEEWLQPFLSGEREQLESGSDFRIRIEIDPQPTQWPDPDAVVHATEEQSSA